MKELREAIRTLSQNYDEVYSIVAKVKAVDKSKRTCTVEPLNGDAALFGVRLQSEESSDKGLVVFPKVGSSVIVTFLNRETGHVTAFSEWDNTEFVLGQLKVKVDTEGVHLERNGGDLRKIIDAIVENSEKTFDFLLKLKVVTPSGVGTLSPDIAVQVTTEKAKLSALKNQIKQLLT